jgi:membrane peptidoglycan carboxypeptidase
MFRRDDQTHLDKKTGKPLNNPFLKMYGTGGAPTIHGNSFPAQIWKDYMNEALHDSTPVPFQKPSSKVGTLIYGNVPSPTPTPTETTPTPTTPPPTMTTPPTTPPTTPTWTPPTMPTDTPTTPCFPWDKNCGSTPTPTDTTPTPTGTPTGRNPNKPNTGG